MRFQSGESAMNPKVREASIAGLRQMFKTLMRVNMSSAKALTRSPRGISPENWAKIKEWEAEYNQAAANLERLDAMSDDEIEALSNATLDAVLGAGASDPSLN
jgi:hypothetical protein